MAAGAAGGVMSGAAAPTVGETLPTASDRVALIVPPLAWAGVSGTAKRPSPSTIPVPITVPAPSRTVTVAPTSPDPIAWLPVASTLRVGAAGGVMSGAIAVTGAERFPAASPCITSTTSPLAWGGVSGTA